MASDEHIEYMDNNLERILSPKSPVMAEAVFGSAPRSRRPSTPKSPPSSVPATTATPAATPTRKEKALPPVPSTTQSRPRPRVNTTLPERPRPVNRADSPDVETMIARTPRPRRKSSATFTSPILRARSTASLAIPSSWKGLKAEEKKKDQVAGDNESVISDYGTLLKDDDSDFERQLEGEGSESDSSIDIHTPLPHLMFRDGLLSPRSKLLPAGTATLSLYMDDDAGGQRANSVLSVASTTASTVTKSGVYRDPRDTQRRRRRHKDQSLLRAGMGLTTGLGWSDSEDEDAPSMLTRRLISTSLARQPTVSSTGSRIQSQLTKSTSVGNLSHPPPSYSPLFRPGARPLSRSTSASFSTRLSSADMDRESLVNTEPLTRARTASNASASSIVSSGSRDSSGPAQSVASSQTSQGRSAVPRPLRLPQTAGVQTQTSIARSSSASDSHPPVTATSKLVGARPHARTRTLSNPARAPGSSVLPRPAASKIVPPRSVSASVMAPVRSRSISSIGTSERGSVLSEIADFPLPPSSASPAPAVAVRGLPRPSVNTQISRSTTASPISPPSASRVHNTVGTGLRPRIGTGMAYRSSGYSSFYEASRLSRASVASSSSKEVGVM